MANGGFAVANQGNQIQSALQAILQQRQQERTARLADIRQRATQEGQERRSLASQLGQFASDPGMREILAADPSLAQRINQLGSPLEVAKARVDLAGPGAAIKAGVTEQRARSLKRFESGLIESRQERQETRRRKRGLTSPDEIEGEIIERARKNGFDSLTENDFDVLKLIRRQKQTQESAIPLRQKEAALDIVLQTKQQIATFSSALQKAKQLGAGAAGLRLKAGEFAAGPISQISESLGRSLTAAVTGGLSPEQVRDFSLRMQNLVAESVEFLTGEGTARVSGFELALAQKATGFTAAGASIAQVKRGIETLMVFAIVRADTEARTAGLQLEFDHRTPEGRRKFAEFAAGLGLSHEAGKEAWRTIRQNRGFLQDSGINF